MMMPNGAASIARFFTNSSCSWRSTAETSRTVRTCRSAVVDETATSASNSSPSRVTTSTSPVHEPSESTAGEIPVSKSSSVTSSAIGMASVASSGS